MSGVVPQGIFDSEESVLKALSVIRNSTLKVEEKSHLRDLFLDYAGEVGEDRRDTLRTEILNKLRVHAAALPTLPIPKETTPYREEVSVENKPAAVAEVAPTIGTRRPVPAFRAPVVEEVALNTPSPTPAPEPVVAAPKEAVIAVPEPTESQSVSAPVAEAPAAAPGNLRARIDQIKHDINGKVGNPVNLINADENIGREYMSALLDAMKSTSGGGGEAPAAARLETAYRAALSLIEKMSASSIPAPVETTPSPKEEVREVAEVETMPTPEPVSAPIENEVSEIAPVEAPVTVEAIPEPEPTKSYGLYHQPIDESDEMDEPKKPIEQKEPEKVPDEASSSGERRVKIDTPKFGSPKAEPLHSLRDEVTLPEQMAKVKADGAKREAAAKKPITDLKSPEVQSGLEQLLTEWKLFHSSGFLGTGPKGINHPLYKQLAGLPMAAVVAGRFEGVTPLIKQSLTDYMNGWRYEQGIVHEMGETFENYLRRVIKQILTRQRVSISS